MTCRVGSKPAQSMTMSGPCGGSAARIHVATSWGAASLSGFSATSAPSFMARSKLSLLMSAMATASAPNALTAISVTSPACPRMLEDSVAEKRSQRSRYTPSWLHAAELPSHTPTPQDGAAVKSTIEGTLHLAHRMQNKVRPIRLHLSCNSARESEE